MVLWVLLNRIKGKAGGILAEEEAGFRPKRSRVEQIFNMRLLIETHLRHQRVLCHNSIDFKKAFDRVWHEGLWQVMKNFNFNKALYEEYSSAVLQNNTNGDFFHTSDEVRQGCLLSPILSNIWRTCRRLSTSSTPSFPQEDGRYATYALQTTLTSWEAAKLNKTAGVYFTLLYCP